MNIAKIKVGVLVVTFNREKLLQETIESIRNQTYSNFDIIVVNNGSTDGTDQWLSNQKDLITITQRNLGGAGGFFTGMKYIAENNYDYCWLMDDDVECTHTALEELLYSINIHPNIGFVCSKVIGLDGQVMNTPSVYSATIENAYPNWFEHIDKQMIKVKDSTFVSVLVSTQVIKEVGLPYKEYFIWGDDSEYTRRISSKYSSYLSCKSVVVHKRTIQGILSLATETNKHRIKNYFYMYRNRAHIAKVHDGIIKYFKFMLSVQFLFLKFLCSFKFTKSIVILRALIAAIVFNPRIQFSK